MGNIWFYTLSTIPQTLAAVIALFAIFVVYKVTQIDQVIRIEFLPKIKRLLTLINNMKLSDRRRTNFSDYEILDLIIAFDKLDSNDVYLGLGKELYEKIKEEWKIIIREDRGKTCENPEKEILFDYLIGQKYFF
jgi:hypothetical protein